MIEYNMVHDFIIQMCGRNQILKTNPQLTIKKLTVLSSS